jgi:alkylation response protein AidB-like acyl-CoA dehydrogenase
LTEQAIQILGGNGYTRKYPAGRWHRDAEIFTIFDGTSENPADDHRARGDGIGFR